jgi:hypothetical protein
MLRLPLICWPCICLVRLPALTPCLLRVLRAAWANLVKAATVLRQHHEPVTIAIHRWQADCTDWYPSLLAHQCTHCSRCSCAAAIQLHGLYTRLFSNSSPSHRALAREADSYHASAAMQAITDSSDGSCPVACNAAVDGYSTAGSLLDATALAALSSAPLYTADRAAAALLRQLAITAATAAFWMENSGTVL